jgi:4-methylaminobutanoate oxidase (formaldehyde-forming)
LWDVLWQAGQPEGMVPVGYKAIDRLRIEKGYRYWSAEITPDYTPLEAGLGFAVKFNKGDFIGLQALLEQKETGINQKLCCLTLADDRTIALGNEPIRLRGLDTIVGWVASGGYGYSVGRSIAFAYLPVEYAVLGMELEIEIFAEKVSAVVEQSPLYDPKGERIRV